MKLNIPFIAAGIVLAGSLIACKDSANSSSSANQTNQQSSLAKIFPKSTQVFGTSIVATESTPDNKILHAANVMAEYLDNNEDGIADNPAVVELLKTRGATLLMANTPEELEAVADQLPENDAYQDLYGSEIIVGNTVGGEFDATLEEVLHLITHVGYAGVYPDVFGEAAGSVIADAMDIARGGQFQTIPASYPAGAWYTYNDQTCDYSCMVTEYVYWSLTSILGAQNSAARLADIKQEWSLNTPALVQEKDTAVYNLLTDVQYALPSKLPNGSYDAKTFSVTKTSASNVVDNSDVVSVRKTVFNENLSFELQFMGSLNLENNKTESWTAARQQPFIDASTQWLLSLRGIEGQTAHHTIKIKVRVKTLPGGNGMAGPDTDFILADKAFPATGEMLIGNHTYAAGFDSVEFYANILHEMGHIIGIGSYTEPYVSLSGTYKGNVFRVPGSKAVEEYNRIYATTYDFVPFSDDGGHLYDNLLQEDKKRILDNGTVLPPLTKEFMANGVKFGRVTLGVLDDIGYVIDYNNAEIYTP